MGLRSKGRAPKMAEIFMSAYNAFVYRIGRQLTFTHYPPVNPRQFTEGKFVFSRPLTFLSLEDTLALVGIALAFLIVRPIANRLIFLPIARVLGVLREEEERWNESFWQGSVYLAFWITCSYAIADEPFFTETWRCWEEPFPNQVMTNGIYWTYMMEMAWYLQSVYTHVFVDSRKKDYYEMLLHHFAAFALIYGSFNLGYWRVGTLGLYCLDLCDVFLHLCKLFRHVDNARPVAEFWKVSSFGALLVLWVYFRLYLFATKFLWASAALGIPYAGWQNCDFIIPFNILTIFIYGLQWMWFFMIARIAYMKVVHGMELDDDRDATSKVNEAIIEKHKAKQS